MSKFIVLAAAFISVLSLQALADSSSLGFAEDLIPIDGAIADSLPANAGVVNSSYEMQQPPALECRQRTLRASEEFAVIRVAKNGALSRVPTRYSSQPILANMVFKRSTGPGDRAHYFESVQLASLSELFASLPHLKVLNQNFLATTVSADVKQLKQDNLFILENLMKGEPRTDWFDTRKDLASQATLIVSGTAQIVDEASGRYVDSFQTLYVLACPKLATEGCRSFNVLNEQIIEADGTENKRFEVGHFVCKSL